LRVKVLKGNDLFAAMHVSGIPAAPSGVVRIEIGSTSMRERISLSQPKTTHTAIRFPIRLNMSRKKREHNVEVRTCTALGTKAQAPSGEARVGVTSPVYKCPAMSGA
jgi:hypothetical protein